MAPMIDYRVLIQARMSSNRFPGKALAPLLGRPMIASALARLCEFVPRERMLLVTSQEVTDDPLADYVSERLDFNVFRGALDNVVGRFQSALKEYPAEWFVRICGDSPAIDPNLLCWMLSRLTADTDLMSNAVRRTFPPGQSIEIVRTSRFLEIDLGALDADEREHITLIYYRHPDEYRITAVESADTSMADRRLVVDTIEDMRKMEEILMHCPELTRGYEICARIVGNGA